MKFSEKLFNLRKQYGLSQDDLAIKLDISRQAVYKWENDQSKPELDKLKMLSNLFNVSIDNLLDDNADISVRNTSSKKSLSEVTALNTPSVSMAEEVNTNYTDQEKKRIKIRKGLINYSLIGIIIASLMLIAYLVITLASEEYGKLQEFAFMFLLPFGFILFGISITVHLVSKKFVFPNAYETRSYFYDLKDKAENYFKSKGYEFIILQSDLPVWFFYDLVNDDKFGIYFDGKEQFVCPIQNYLNLTGETATEGAFKVDFSYLDSAGEVKEYAFLLSTIRPYMALTTEDKAFIEYYFETLEKSTKKIINGIKAKLDAKK